MASGIYKHNPGPRAFRIMYREVRVFLSTLSCTSDAGYLSSQGMLWLVAATLVEIVPIVSRVHSLLGVNDAHSLQVFLILNLNGKVFYMTVIYEMTDS